MISLISKKMLITIYTLDIILFVYLILNLVVVDFMFNF